MQLSWHAWSKEIEAEADRAAIVFHIFHLFYDDVIYELQNNTTQCHLEAAGVEASCDVCGIFVGESAARASVFVFLAMKESIRFTAEVGDLFRDKDPAHFRKGLHNTLHTLPIYQVKVMDMGDVSLIEELSSHLFSPIMGELPLSRSSKLFHTDEFSHLLKWE